MCVYTKITNSFKIVKHYVPMKNRKTLFEAYFVSKLQYGIEIYGGTNHKLSHSLQIKQNRALKTLYNLDFLTPTKKMHKDYKILMVKDRYKLNINKFVHKQQNKKLPEILNNYYNSVKDSHNHKTRTNDNLIVNKHKTEIGKRSIKIQGAIAWNSLPFKIRKEEKLKNFVKSAQTFYINNY